MIMAVMLDAANARVRWMVFFAFSMCRKRENK
jgi:hypothetical protein